MPQYAVRTTRRRLAAIVARLCLGSLLVATPLAAQEVIRLPPTDLVETPYPVQQTVYPGSTAAVLQPPGEPSLAVVETLPPEHRAGMFQKVIFESTYLPRTGADGMGVNDLEGRLVLAVPCPTKDSPLLIMPGYAVHYLDGPADADVPPRLHDAYCQFRWLSQVTPRWGADISFTPGVASDFEQSSDKAVRYNGYAAAAYTWSPAAKLVLGFGHFDRLSYRWLPIGGLIWTPNEDVDCEILFPRPWLGHRVYWFGANGKCVQDWAYVAAEFGGGAWAMARSDGTSDVIDLRDYRIYCGLQRKVRGGLDARLELGYVFGRRIAYQSGGPEVSVNDTLMLRGGLSY